MDSAHDWALDTYIVLIGKVWSVPRIAHYGLNPGTESDGFHSVGHPSLNLSLLSTFSAYFILVIMFPCDALD